MPTYVKNFIRSIIVNVIIFGAVFWFFYKFIFYYFAKLRAFSYEEEIPYRY